MNGSFVWIVISSSYHTFFNNLNNMRSIGLIITWYMIIGIDYLLPRKNELNIKKCKYWRTLIYDIVSPWRHSRILEILSSQDFLSASSMTSYPFSGDDFIWNAGRHSTFSCKQKPVSSLQPSIYVYQSCLNWAVFRYQTSVGSLPFLANIFGHLSVKLILF